LSETTRREFLQGALVAGTAITTSRFAPAVEAQIPATGAPSSATPAPVHLSWLGEAPPLTPVGINWGVPWPQGAVTRAAVFSLRAPAGDLPLQTWPLAFWPDGSVKWSGFAAVVAAGLAGPLTLIPGSSPAAGTLRVSNDSKTIVVDTGVLQCSIPLAGSADLVSSMTIEGRPGKRPERPTPAGEICQLSQKSHG